MLDSFIYLCVGTYVVGYLLSLILFKIKKKRFKGSKIQTKVHMWVPIFGVVLAVYVGSDVFRWVLLSLLLAAIVWDFVQVANARSSAAAIVYTIVVIVGTMALWRIASTRRELFLAVWYLSVVSDVTAYFLGNFIGSHKLPKILNNKKSWEGVIGQLLGALIGFELFAKTVQPPESWLWLVVGLGCAAGDILNSYTKRELGIKDWSNRLPGHGGMLDRMSSLSLAALMVTLVKL